MKKQLLIILLFCVIVSPYLAQDIHHSQINNSSTFLNPAQSGLIHEKYRISLISRRQYMSVAPYTTQFISFDTRLKSNYNQFMGGGFILYQDKSGDGSFTSTLIQLPFSYTTRYDGNNISYLSFGGAAGANINTISYNKFYFEKQYNGSSFDTKLSSGEAFNDRRYVYSNFAAGANYVYLFNKTENLAGGVSVRYFTKPQRILLKNSAQFSTQFTVHFTYQKMLNDILRLHIQSYYSRQNKFREVVNSVNIEYQLVGEDNERKIIFGVQNRWQDSFTLISGYQYNKLTLNLSYDMVYSSYKDATKLSGAVELGMRYVFTPKKEANPTISKKQFVFL